MRKLLPLLRLVAVLALLARVAPSYGASDSFTGGSGLLSAHDSNWALANTAGGESLSNWSIDGSGFAVITATFQGPEIFYTGTDCTTQKSEIVLPIGAFSSWAGAERVGPSACSGTGSRGFTATTDPSRMTGQVVNALRFESNGNYLQDVGLSPTIDTSSVALTVSVQRTSTTNVNVIVNGTTYAVNTTGFDITSGALGISAARAGGTTTMKIDSWTNGVAGGSTFLIPTKGPRGSLGGPVGYTAPTPAPRTPIPTWPPLMAANDDTFRLRVSR